MVVWLWFWLILLEDLAATDSPASWDAVPWALGVFTAEFGMGSGVWLPAMATRSSSKVSDQGSWAGGWGRWPAITDP